MAETLADSLAEETTIPAQIVIDQRVDDSTILQENINETITTTTIESGSHTSQHAQSIVTSAPVSLSEEIATSNVLRESMSVSTQVNVMSESAMDAGLEEQNMLQGEESGVLEGDDSLAQASDTVTISQHTIVGIDGGLQIASNGLEQTSANFPPWASRLHDCELIGDSYRGYVTNEVELDLILTLHKQHTNSCWGTRQSPSSAKPSIRLMWKSQYVPYDGIPFLNTGRRATVMECQYGPRRKGCIAKKSNEYEDESGQLKKPHRPTCPARIYIKKVRKFPEYRIDPNLEGKNVRQAQERALTTLRLAGVEMGGEERFYVQLPLPIAHEYHDTDDVPMATLEDQGQRLNQQIISKIQEYVARGVTGLYAIKHLLKEFVEKEMFSGQEAPPKHNKAYFPTIIDIQNHMHQAQMALASGTLMALPPLTNLQIPNQHKDRPRKRRNHEKVTQTPQGLATVHAIASIQQHLDDSISEEEQKQSEQEDLEQQLNKIHPHNTGEHQILVTPSNGMHVQTKDGQVVIVVTSNSVFSSQQDSETPNTFALTALPASQINTLSHGTLGTLGAGGQTVLITHPGEHGQYLTQSDNILTVLNSGLATTDEGALLGIASKGVGTTAATRPSVPEQLLASQAAVAAVLNAAAASIGSDEDSKQADEEGKEPPAKRRAMATIDLSSLVKEAVVYDHSQGQMVTVNEDHVTTESHVTSSAQLTSALQAQSTSALNTTIPITFETKQEVAAMEAQPQRENEQDHAPTVLEGGAIGDYADISIPSTTAPQLMQANFEVRDLRQVAMETSDETMATTQVIDSFCQSKSHDMSEVVKLSAELSQDGVSGNTETIEMDATTSNGETTEVFSQVATSYSLVKAEQASC